MDNVSLNSLLENRIEELRKEKVSHQQAIDICDLKIGELESLREVIDKMAQEEKKKNVQENIRKESFKDCFREPDDVKRANVFLEFMDKCGDETIYAKCREKMPKLESLLYRKNRLWHSWKDFLADYNMWVKREGHWANVLTN